MIASIIWRGNTLTAKSEIIPQQVQSYDRGGQFCARQETGVHILDLRSVDLVACVGKKFGSCAMAPRATNLALGNKLISGSCWPAWWMALIEKHPNSLVRTLARSYLLEAKTLPDPKVCRARRRLRRRQRLFPLSSRAAPLFNFHPPPNVVHIEDVARGKSTIHSTHSSCFWQYI
jgi:hypothetical protein